METINHFPRRKEKEEGKRKENNELQFYPPSRREFLDDFTKELYKLKEKKTKEARQLLRAFWKLDSILASYKNIQNQEEEAFKSAREEQKQKGRLEPGEKQALQNRKYVWEYLRGETHEALIQKYYRFILDYEKFLEKKFPWLDPRVFDQEGKIQPQFIQYNSQGKREIDTKHIPQDIRNTVSKWAQIITENSQNQEEAEQLKTLETLLHSEYQKLAQTTGRKPKEI